MSQDQGIQVWAGRFCVAVVLTLTWLGFYFANIRFLPLAAGFAILAGVCYTVARREIPATTPVPVRPSRPQRTIAG